MIGIEVIVSMIGCIIDEVIPCATSEIALKEYIKKAKEFGFEYDYNSIKTEEDVENLINAFNEEHQESKNELHWYSDINLIEK